VKTCNLVKGTPGEHYLFIGAVADRGDLFFDRPLAGADLGLFRATALELCKLALEIGNARTELLDFIARRGWIDLQECRPLQIRFR